MLSLVPKSVPPRYHLVLYRVDGTIGTADLTNYAAYPYDVGDELEIAEGEQWRVARLDVLEDGVPVLICEQLS
jgi:hypothetical protein